ncbi:hypothetical protein ACS8E6_12585 [Salinicola halophyticus]|uniref:hypothetical protein n=1 Tax=Salinicola halophyticus TaxID=1808881 RepID=UPI003F44FF29
MIKGLMFLKSRIFLSEAFNVRDRNGAAYFTRDLIIAYAIILTFIFLVGVFLALILPIKSQDAIIFATALTAALVSFLGVQVNVFNKNKEYRERELEKLVEESWAALQSVNSFFQKYLRFFSDKKEIIPTLKELAKHKEELEEHAQQARERYKNAVSSGDLEGIKNLKEYVMEADKAVENCFKQHGSFVNENRRWLYNKYDECSSDLQNLAIELDRCAVSVSLLGEIKGFKNISSDVDETVFALRKLKQMATSLHNELVNDSKLEVDPEAYSSHTERERLLAFVLRLRQYELKQDDGFFGENSESVRQIAIVLLLVLTTALGYAVCKGLVNDRKTCTTAYDRVLNTNQLGERQNHENYL